VRHRLLLITTLILIAAEAGAVTCTTPVYQWHWVDSATYVNWIMADLNGDGRKDIVANRNQDIYVDLALANGTFAAGVKVFSGAGYTKPVVADYTSDGKADIVVAQYDAGLIKVVPGNGDGTFGAAITTPTGLQADQIAGGDFNGDGKTDLVVSGTAHTVLVLDGNGSGGFSEQWRTTNATSPALVLPADFDNDTHLDFLLMEYNTQISIWYGDGSTFTSGSTVNTYTWKPIIVGDLNGDSLPDVVSVGSDLRFNLNQGARSFAAPVSLTACGSTSYSDVALGDVTGDGHADLVATIAAGDVAVWTGHDDGTFDSASCIHIDNASYTAGLLVTNLDGAGASEILVGTGSGTYANTNVCGQTEMTANGPSTMPVAGDTFTVGAQLRYIVTTTPIPTGTVTFKEGDTVLGESTLSSGGYATLSTPNATAGSHTFTLIYNGDSYYDPHETTVQFTVAEHESTVTIDMPAESVFGQTVPITIHVNGISGGPFDFSTDGGPWLSGNASFINLPPGQHTLRARFNGSETVQRGTSEIATHTVTKATPVLITPEGTTTMEVGSYGLSIYISSVGGHTPSGTLSLFRDATAIDTTPVTSTFTGLKAGLLFVGTYVFHVEYSGDDYLNPVQSPSWTVNVIYTGPPQFRASYRDGHVAFAYVVTSSATTIHFWRTPVGGIGQTEVPASGDDVTSGVYLYWFTAFNAQGSQVATSPKEVIVAMNFTDEDLTVGSTVRAVHFNEILTATNLLRSAAGLSPVSLESLTLGVTTIRASHLTTLREAIIQGRIVAGAQPLSFTDYPINTSHRIRLVHLLEMREALR